MRSEIEELLKDFYTVSGMDISVVDKDFHTLSLTRSPGASLCSLIHKDPTSTDVCKASDIERLTYVKQTKKPLLYTCPYGITEAIAPIVNNDEVIGYVISAFGIVQGNEDEVYSTCSSLKGLERESLDECIKNERMLTEAEANAYFNIIKMLADYVSRDESMLFGEMSIGMLIKRYIRNNLDQKLTLKGIARNLHCSTVTLTEHFKDEFGITINEYVTKKRMELSERLLLSTEKTLREVAYLCGFVDVEYFSRTFKKHHGISPASWRRERKTGEC